jgi:hypothetical protein
MTFRAAFYKGTPPGVRGVYNRLIRWWTRSEYSHGELIFSDGMAGSSSFMDGGVRFKNIDFDPCKWDFIELPAALEPAARAWFELHQGEGYDLLGNLQFVVARVAHDKRKWFCDEAMAAALGVPDPWRYDPATLASTLKFFFHHQPASAGFLLP